MSINQLKFKYYPYIFALLEVENDPNMELYSRKHDRCKDAGEINSNKKAVWGRKLSITEEGI